MSHFYARIEGLFGLLSEAESVVNANRVDRPAANLAASLAWSMAGRYVFLESDLRILEDPTNPNRPRSADASAARTLSLESQIEDTLYMLSYLSGIASKQMLPDPEVLLAGRRNGGQTGGELSAEEVAKLTGQDVREVQDAFEYSDTRRAKVEELRSTVLQDDVTHRWIVRRLKDAMGTALPCPFDDLHPFAAASIFGKMAEKLQLYSLNATDRLRRTLIPRQQREIGAQVHIMRSVAIRADEYMVDAQMRGETSDFEPERAAIPAEGGTDSDE